MISISICPHEGGAGFGDVGVAGGYDDYFDYDDKGHDSKDDNYENVLMAGNLYTKNI